LPVFRYLGLAVNHGNPAFVGIELIETFFKERRIGAAFENAEPRRLREVIDFHHGFAANHFNRRVGHARRNHTDLAVAAYSQKSARRGVTPIAWVQLFAID
jgi:hypothetical protein